MQRRQIIRGIAILAFIQAGVLFGQRLHVDGREMLVSGMNIPWRFYGHDFGGRGHRSFNPDFYDRMFSDLSEAGINTVRIWLHCDGRLSPLRDASATVTGLPTAFLDDLDSFLQLAADHDLMVLPVLWSFEIVDTRLLPLIQDTTRTRSYLEHALKPILERTEKFCNILAWEIINEPEWAMDIPFAGTTGEVVSRTDMQKFVALHASFIHQHSDQRVTVGSAGLRFLSDFSFLTTNYWSDIELQRQNPGCAETYLDFYTVHFYDWNWERLSPFKHNVDKLRLDKPTIVSEFAFSKGDAASTLLKRAVENGYAGVMPWSVNAGDGIATWEDYRSPMTGFSREFTHMMPDTTYCIRDQMSEYYHTCSVAPNPASEYVVIRSLMESAYPMRIEIVSMLGQKVLMYEGSTHLEMNIPTHNLTSGVYVVRFVVGGPDGRMRELNRQKLLISH